MQARRGMFSGMEALIKLANKIYKPLVVQKFTEEITFR